MGGKEGLRVAGARVEGELVDELRPGLDRGRVANPGAGGKEVGLAIGWRDNADADTGGEGGSFSPSLLFTTGFKEVPALEDDREVGEPEFGPLREQWEGFDPETMVGEVEERRLFGNHGLPDELTATATVRF